MQGKVYTIKPGVIYGSQVKKEKNDDKVTFKERLMHSGETFILILLSAVLLVLTVAGVYKSLIYYKVKSEKKALFTEKVYLEKELNRLTSREVVLEKAKQLGLKPPQDKDYINLK